MLIRVKTKKRAFYVACEECEAETTCDKEKSLAKCPWENRKKEKIHFTWDTSFVLEADLRCKRFQDGLTKKLKNLNVQVVTRYKLAEKQTCLKTAWLAKKKQF